MDERTGADQKPAAKVHWPDRETANRTWWEWGHLLVIPLAVLIVGSSFTACQNVAQRRIEAQRASDLALQAYLDQIGTLILNHNLKTKTPFGDVNSVARARTLAVMRNLNSESKGVAVQFLRDSKLIERGEVGVVLSRVDLSGTRLPADAELGGADFYEVDFSNAQLSGAGLQITDLRNADLTGADLSYSDLTDADLQGAKLHGANLTGAIVSKKQLATAVTSSATIMPSDFRDAVAPDESLTMMR